MAQSAIGQVLEIVVVDNDPGQSARPVLAHWCRQGRVPVVALDCPEPNISRARNTAIHAARGPWLAFIDDDETPEPDWLEQLLRTARHCRADAVFAPVVPVYGAQIAPWVVRGRFFERRRLATGAAVTRRDVRSGNVLVRRALLLALPGPFDSSFGRTGGEDTLLFTQLLQSGPVRFVWCDEAVVREPVEPARAALPWLLRRAYRGGQSFVLVAMRTTPRGARGRLLACLLARALAQLGVAGVLTLLSWPFGRAAWVKWLRLACAQCGKMTGAMGFHYQEYKR